MAKRSSDTPKETQVERFTHEELSDHRGDDLGIGEAPTAQIS